MATSLPVLSAPFVAGGLLQVPVHVDGRAGDVRGGIKFTTEAISSGFRGILSHLRYSQSPSPLHQCCLPATSERQTVSEYQLTRSPIPSFRARAKFAKQPAADQHF